MSTPMNPKRRSELRAEAHKLNPTVIIGDKGLTDEVLAEIDRSLKAHELIKVRAATDDRDARNVWMESICEKLEAHPVQQIGKVLVVYRENPQPEPKRAAPASSAPPRRARPAPRARPLAGRPPRPSAPRTKPVAGRPPRASAPRAKPAGARPPRPSGPRTKARTGSAAPSTSRRRPRGR